MQQVELLSPAQSHIIERPRLLKLLDEAAETARVILLVAPAGYGKTTLARQWLSQPARTGFWYRARAEASDPAELGAALSEVLCPLSPDVHARVLACVRGPATAARIQATSHALAAYASHLPPSGWLVIDDCHLLEGSDESRQIIESLALESDLRLLITGRARPTWATARRILYGPIASLDPADLLLTPPEIASVLGSRGAAQPDISHYGLGWPVVAGLAALTHTQAPGDLPLIPTSTLYEYFATELFARVPELLRPHVCALAVAQSLTFNIIERLIFRESPDRVVTTAVSLGIATRLGDSIEMHPLLREFLFETLLRDHTALGYMYLDRALDLFIASRRWDDAMHCAAKRGKKHALLRVMRAGMADYLVAGRVETLRQWIVHAQKLGINAPLVDLVDAEIAARTGRHRDAYALAARAEHASIPDDPLRARALLVAARAAHLDSRPREARELYEGALARAAEAADRREALWGQFMTAVVLEAKDVGARLQDVLAVRADTPADAIRAVTARLFAARLLGSMDTAARDAFANMPLADRVPDPLPRSSYYHNLSYSLMLTGRYAEADDLTIVARKYASDAGLAFALPHADLVEADVAVGRRDFRRAARLVDQAYDYAQQADDLSIWLNAAIVTAHLHLSQRKPTERSLDPPDRCARHAFDSHWAEWRAVQALAEAAHGDARHAQRMAAKARAESVCVEVITTAACADAVAAIRGRTRGEDEVAAAWQASVDCGVFHPLVIACRLEPTLMTALAQENRRLALLRRIFDQSHDHLLARRAGIDIAVPTRRARGLLSKRELEVLDLLARGLTNREIAHALFISEVTVKVHVRHILEKLGARTRTQAALIAKDHHVL